MSEHCEQEANERRRRNTLTIKVDDITSPYLLTPIVPKIAPDGQRDGRTRWIPQVPFRKVAVPCLSRRMNVDHSRQHVHLTAVLFWSDGRELVVEFVEGYERPRVPVEGWRRTD